MLFTHSLAGNCVALVGSAPSTCAATAAPSRSTCGRTARSDAPRDRDYAIASMARDVAAARRRAGARPVCPGGTQHGSRRGDGSMPGRSRGGSIACCSSIPSETARNCPPAEMEPFLAALESPSYPRRSRATGPRSRARTAPVGERLLRDLRATSRETVLAVLKAVAAFDPKPALAVVSRSRAGRGNALQQLSLQPPPPGRGHAPPRGRGHRTLAAASTGRRSSIGFWIGSWRSKLLRVRRYARVGLIPALACASSRRRYGATGMRSIIPRAARDLLRRSASSPRAGVVPGQALTQIRAERRREQRQPEAHGLVGGRAHDPGSTAADSDRPKSRAQVRVGVGAARSTTPPRDPRAPVPWGGSGSGAARRPRGRSQGFRSRARVPQRETPWPRTARAVARAPRGLRPAARARP